MECGVGSPSAWPQLCQGQQGPSVAVAQLLVGSLWVVWLGQRVYTEQNGCCHCLAPAVSSDLSFDMLQLLSSSAVSGRTILVIL